MVECTAFYGSLFIGTISLLIGLASICMQIWPNYYSNLSYYITEKTYGVTEKRYFKDYPSTKAEQLHLLFSTFNIPSSTKNLIRNVDMETEFTQILKDSLHYEGIYLIYGENGIGKSTAFQKILNNHTTLNYIYIENGFEELIEKVAPDYNKDSKYTAYRVIQTALNQYSDYRKAQNLQKNALIILYNVNKIPEIDLIQLKDIAKYFVDKSKPIVFIFLSSEGKGPTILMKNMSRMEVKRLNEPSKHVAFEYFKKIGVNPSYIERLENITGGAFKYLTQIRFIDSSLSENEFFEG